MSVKNSSFEYKNFISPDVSYSPVYSWVWNGPLSKEETDKGLQEMQRLGMRAFYILPEPVGFRPSSQPTFLDPDYLTPAYFEHYKYVIEKAKELGMQCWFYDEGGWPSGSACGKLLLEHPEYARRGLGCRKIEYKAGDRYAPSDEDAAAAFIDGTKMIEAGFAFGCDTVVDEYYSKRFAFQAAGCADYPDLTMKEATKTFIEMTHQQYKKHLGEDFGSFIDVVFTDEPCAPPIPFRKELCDIYEEKYGESILPYLPVLLNVDYVTDDNIHIRRRWFDLCSRLFCENFMLECKKWSNEHGMKFSGHLDDDDTFKGCMGGRSYHLMRGLRCMDMPGVDAIWRQIFPGEKRFVEGIECAANRFFPRYASSAAAQIGEDLAMTEILGVYGNSTTFDQIRFVAGFHAVRGVTVLNPMSFAYSNKGFQMLVGGMFSETKACHADMPVFNRYAERLSYVCSCGDRVCDTALYYPVCDAWGGRDMQAVGEEYEALGFALEAKAVDFDILDDDVLDGATGVENGVIKFGKATYRKIYIPKNAYISDRTAEVLKTFTDNGGQVYYSAEGAKSNVEFTSDCAKIRTMKRIADGTELIILFNEDEVKRNVELTVDAENCSLINITEGKMVALKAENGKVKVSLECGETCAVYMAELPESKTEKIYTNTMLLDGKYDFRPTKSFVIGYMYPETHILEKEPVPMELGDWSSVTGRDFSGSGVYTTSFKGVNGDAILDLGEVKYTCEVTLNGQNLGVKVMKPYRYHIPAELMQEENRLEIRVSNTPGNQFYHTKSFDKWGKWMLSPYQDKLNAFYEECLDSGLYGPVKLIY